MSKIEDALSRLSSWRTANMHRGVLIKNEPALYTQSWSVHLWFHGRNYPKPDPSVNVLSVNIGADPFSPDGLADTIIFALDKVAERETEFSDPPKVAR